MKTTVLFWLAGMSVATCRAQTACDSLYRQVYAHPPRQWFTTPPRIVAGRERLVTYLVPHERAGRVYFQVLIDEHGATGCLQWLGATSAAVQAEAAAVVAGLRFSPGMRGDQPVQVPMTLVVRFEQGPPPSKKALRQARRAQAH